MKKRKNLDLSSTEVKEPKKPLPKKSKKAKSTRNYRLEGKLFKEGQELSAEDVKLFDKLKCKYIT